MKIGILAGNGIGPEIVAASKAVIEATGLAVEWVSIPSPDEALAKYGHPLPPEIVQTLREVKYTLKGPMEVLKTKGRVSCTLEDGTQETYPSINNAFRRRLKLFASPRMARSVPGFSQFQDVDLTIIRELTEDVYIGWENTLPDVMAQAIKLCTRTAVERISHYAFSYARENGRKKVTCVHKANAISITDGLFLKVFREVAKQYPDIQSDDYMVDATAFYLATRPQMFDVIVTSNQYGDILSDLAGGVVGSLGLVPGGNLSHELFIAEASHGSAPDIAGKGIANPVALLLSGAVMLRFAGQRQEAQRIEDATYAVLAEGRYLTPDMGGKAGTQELTDAIVQKIRG
jgi:isocitrate dehydrogenase (NAD+)